MFIFYPSLGGHRCDPCQLSQRPSLSDAQTLAAGAPHALRQGCQVLLEGEEEIWKAMEEREGCLGCLLYWGLRGSENTWR